MYQWTILTSGKRVPPSHRSAQEIGTQPEDERVRSILKAWWTGLSLSSSVPISSNAPTATATERPSSHVSELFSEPTPRAQPEPQPEALMPPPPAPMEAERKPAEAVKVSSAHPNVADSQPRDDIMSRWPTMSRRLGGKNSRGLPSWLFDDPSPEQQAQLDQIRVFGLDVVRERTNPQSQREAGSSGDRSQNSAKSQQSQQQSLTPPLDEDAGPIEVEIPADIPVESQPPPTPPMSSSPPHRTPVQTPQQTSTQAHRTPLPRHRTPHHPDPSSDDEIAVRPLRQRPRPDSSFGSETPAPEPHFHPASAPVQPSTTAEEAGDTSESELSEYERSRRRAMKRRADPQPSQDSQSLSQSQDSREFDLARYEFPLSMPVDMPIDTPSRPGTRSMPPLSRSSPVSGSERPDRAGKRARVYEVDDSMGPPPAHRPRTEEPSGRWRELPFAEAWGEMGPPSAQRVTPVKREFGSAFPSQALLTPPTAPTTKEPPQPPDAEPEEEEEEEVEAEQEEQEVKAETTDESASLPKDPRPQFSHNSHESLAPRPSPRRIPAQLRVSHPFASDSGSGDVESKPEVDSEPSERSGEARAESGGSGRELLGGWKPNLSVRGLNADWVRKVTKAAEDVRDRRQVKRER